MNEHYDVIVIGAGIGGLAAAGLLARSGQSVLVLERHAVVGGCCSTFRRAHFVFDAAVHAIGGCAPDDSIGLWLKELDIENEICFAELDPFYTIAIGDESFAVPANLDELGELLISISPTERNAILNFVQTIKLLGHTLLDDDSSNLMQRSSSLEQIIHMSWSDLLAEQFTSMKVITILCTLCSYAGLEAEKVSGAFMATVLYSYHRGAYYPLGSTQRLVDTMAQAVRRYGGEIVRRATVEKILLDEQQRVRGVRFTRKQEVFEVCAPVVISNGDAYKTLYELVGPEHLPRDFQRRFRRQERSASALCLYLAVREEGLALSTHETFYFPAWEPLTTKQFYYEPGSVQLPLSVCIPSLTDRSLAPAGHHVLALTTLAHPEDVEAIRDQQGKQFLEQDLLRHAEKLIPGLTSQILYKELATPRTIERYTNNGAGAVYGWAKSAQQWPLGIRSGTPIQGLHLAGHWTRGGHGIYGAFRSGVTTARAIIEQEFSKRVGAGIALT